MNEQMNTHHFIKLFIYVIWYLQLRLLTFDHLDMSHKNGKRILRYSSIQYVAYYCSLPEGGDKSHDIHFISRSVSYVSDRQRDDIRLAPDLKHQPIRTLLDKHLLAEL